MVKYRDNVAAVSLIKKLEAERRRATPAEQKVLARYVGWGGIPNAFKNPLSGEVKEDWSKEVAELEVLMTPREPRARLPLPGMPTTAKPVVDFMYAAVWDSTAAWCWSRLLVLATSSAHAQGCAPTPM